jgi:hypothetical protein
VSVTDLNNSLEMPEVDIQSLAIRADGGIEVTFTEARDLTDKIGIAKVLIFDSAEFRVSVEELMESIRDLVDEVLKAHRHAKEKQDDA